ncbi:E3 ubiquitin-protein ligase rad18 [Savitreella phatthalungensis]
MVTLDEWDELLPNLAQTTPSLRALDELCRCRICREYVTAPLMTGCGHTFCSLCIRRAIAADQCCPVCRSKEEERQLRKNVTVEDLVEIYTGMRNELAVRTSRKRRRKSSGSEQDPVDSIAEPRRADQEDRSQRRSLRLSQSEKQVCPFCGKSFAEEEINEHANKCLDQAPVRPEETSVGSKRSSMQRLPKLSYSALTEGKLRAALKELGLPTTGSKAQLQKRHLEMVHLWNSNLDAKQPRSRRALLQDMATWERTVGRITHQSKLSEEDVSRLRDGGDFDDLIAKARASVRKKVEGGPIEEAQDQELEAHT